MAFIKVQKLKKDENGSVISGSAAVVESVYCPGEGSHSKQKVRERLGKIVSLSDDRKSGIFLSPTRGLVRYDSISDTFSDVDEKERESDCSSLFSAPEVHTVFGDSYLLLDFLEKQGLLSVFRAVFPKKSDLERLLCHVLHGVLRDGSHISCDDFIEKSYSSYLFTEVPFSSLRSDTAFFTMMGDDRIRMDFFRSFICLMRKENPDFGKGCYVDSTPLPNAIHDNPFNALCCHGVSSSQIQTRLVLVLDEVSGLPVWYEIIPGNILDLSTVMNIVNDVASSLDIEIESLVLDAGYVCKPLIEAFHIGSEKTVISRMPARRGYPFKELYWKVKGMISRGKYQFVRENHTYFGKKEEITLFGKYREYAYVFVDHDNANLRFRDYLLENEEGFQKLKDRDKDWQMVKNGYFVLISNIDTTPEDLLSRYFCRTEIEGVFKTSKEYLELLPLSKWSDQTVRGKILHDIINTIIFLKLRQVTETTGISVSRLLGKTQSLMCFKNQYGEVLVEVPNKKVKQFYKVMKTSVPSSVNIAQETVRILG